MKIRFLIPALAIASSAVAQTTATTTTTSVPMAPIVVPAQPAAPAATGTNPMQFIQMNAAGDNSQKLQQGLAAAVLLGCVKKQAGADRTNAFYQEIQDTGKQVGAMCKAGQYDQARRTVLAKLDAKKGDPMLPILDGCYKSQASNVAGLSSPEIAAQIAKYDGWAMNPAKAHAEMTNQDICKKAPHA